jgi:hypothetical protein
MAKRKSKTSNLTSTHFFQMSTGLNLFGGFGGDEKAMMEAWKQNRGAVIDYHRERCIRRGVDAEKLKPVAYCKFECREYSNCDKNNCCDKKL